METTSSKRLAMSWLALVILTLLGWLVSEPAGSPLMLNAKVTLLVVAAATLKCYIIMRDFMEVKPATTPKYIRLFCNIWLLALTGCALGIYFVL
ncbi:cytochrome C oxidase subunit IV family protein [Zhongshania sp.]|uniref:cytochrome C oxidase subunit IV family protein n=1 Tax=Zhongshania sp. TaxID=1971902 RepID=UPI00356A536E